MATEGLGNSVCSRKRWQQSALEGTRVTFIASAARVSSSSAYAGNYD